MTRLCLFTSESYNNPLIDPAYRIKLLLKRRDRPTGQLIHLQRANNSFGIIGMDALYGRRIDYAKLTI